MQLKILIITFLSLVFIGCGNKNIDINSIEVPRTQLNLSEPDKVKMNEINFIVITENNSNTIFKQLNLADKDKVLICLSDDDYINMSKNLLELKNYIIKQQQIIKAYKDYYEKNEK